MWETRTSVTRMQGQLPHLPLGHNANGTKSLFTPASSTQSCAFNHW